MLHELTYVETDDGYGDGLDDAYRCTCGETFQANGDVEAAFRHGQETASPDGPPLALVHVDGGIAEEWYTVEGTGKPQVHILDFDREGETDEEQATFIAIARDALALFKARGVDTSDLDGDLDDMEEMSRAG